MVGGGAFEFSNLLTAKITTAVIMILSITNVISERLRMVSLVFEPSPPTSFLIRLEKKYFEGINIF